MEKLVNIDKKNMATSRGNQGKAPKISYLSNFFDEGMKLFKIPDYLMIPSEYLPEGIHQTMANVFMKMMKIENLY